MEDTQKVIECLRAAGLDDERIEATRDAMMLALQSLQSKWPDEAVTLLVAGAAAVIAQSLLEDTADAALEMIGGIFEATPYGLMQVAPIPDEDTDPGR